MKKRIIALGLLWCLSAVMLQAARVDTVLVRSAAMNKDVKVVYVLPDKAIGKQACPVVSLMACGMAAMLSFILSGER